MRGRRGTLLALWLVLAASDAHRARGDGASDLLVCAHCHEQETALAIAAGGHAPSIDCLTCHDDRRPGIFGHGHRAKPTSCTAHHLTPVETHPPPTRKLGPAKLQRSCLKCHDPHGSTNSHLILTAIRTGNRLRPVDFHDPGDGVSQGFVDPTRPGRGLCEI